MICRYLVSTQYNKELIEENAELKQRLSSASRESIQKKLEIQR